MSTADHVHVTKTTNPDTARRASPEQRRTLLGIGLGNALETFDWAAYALFAPFFATQIFNPADPGAALLATFAVFGAGFLIRPFGAIAFGWIADRKGRKFSLIAAILCASAGLLLIGVAPTYENAGLLGAGILLLARLLQGVAHTRGGCGRLHLHRRGRSTSAKRPLVQRDLRLRPHRHPARLAVRHAVDRGPRPPADDVVGLADPLSPRRGPGPAHACPASPNERTRGIRKASSRQHGRAAAICACG